MRGKIPLTEARKCHHQTVFEVGKGLLILAVHCGSFGEPNGNLDIWFNGKGGTEWSLPALTPEEAIAIGEQIIARAKQARAQRKRWLRKDIPGYLPLEWGDLDIEDGGAETEKRTDFSS